MKPAWKLFSVRCGILLLVALTAAGCATMESLPRHFFAMPARELGDFRLPGQAEFERNEAIILVAGGEGYDGRTLAPKIFRVGVVKPIYVGKPVTMTATEPHWWSIGALAPGKYLVHLDVDRRRASQQIQIAVVP